MNFQRLLNFARRNTGDVAKAVAPGSALAAGFGLLEGTAAAATYGLMDFAAAYPATMLARGLTRNVKNPLVRSTAENVANIGASLGSTIAASNLIYGNQGLAPQASQVAQQVEQRSLVNQLPLQEQLVSPGTQFQMAGLPDSKQFEQFLNQQGGWINYLSPEDQALLQQARGV